MYYRPAISCESLTKKIYSYDFLSTFVRTLAYEYGVLSLAYTIFTNFHISQDFINFTENFDSIVLPKVLQILSKSFQNMSLFYQQS